jgi:hypothetical protein
MIVLCVVLGMLALACFTVAGWLLHSTRDLPPCPDCVAGPVRPCERCAYFDAVSMH